MQRRTPKPLPMHLGPRCGAKTRSGTPCRSPAMANGRCRMHGGKSPPAEPPHRAPRRTSPAPRQNRQGTRSAASAPPRRSPPSPRRSPPGHGPAHAPAARTSLASGHPAPGRSPSLCRPCENSGGDGDGGLGHHDLRRSHVIWRFGAGSPAEGAPGLGGSMWGARFWLDSRLMPSRRRSRREHLPARSRGGCCEPAP